MKMPNRAFDFRQLIAPISEKIFKEEYWEKKPLVIKRKDPQYYQILFSLQCVDELLSTFSSLSPNVLVAKDGPEVPLKSLIPEGHNSLSIEYALREFTNGATLILPQIQETWPALRTFCHRLSAHCSARFQINGYLTPRKAQGFGEHYDTHDVFVAQISGAKRWTLLSSSIKLPLSTQPYVHNPNESTEVVDEFELDPGDLLYLPRGIVHKAVALEETSLHLTIGITPILWAQLIQSVVNSAIMNDSIYRMSLPFGYMKNRDLQCKIQHHLIHLMNKLSQEAKYDLAVDEACELAELALPVIVDRRLRDLETLKKLSIDTPVCVRSYVNWSIEHRHDEVCLLFHGKEVCMPSYSAGALHFMKDIEGSFSAGQLPEGLDEEGRMVLVRRLIREGLLTTSTSDGPDSDV